MDNYLWHTQTPKLLSDRLQQLTQTGSHKKILN
jgi:hypothetical protein